MKYYNNLPIYEIEFDEELSVFNNVSFVTRPAIEEGFIRLSKQDDVKIQLKINEESRIVTGPALIPGQPIYRDQGGHKFYITWTEDTIKQVAINFFQHNRQTQGNIEHQFSFNGVCFFESYILNKERGLVPKEFEDLPNGTWMLSARIWPAWPMLMWTMPSAAATAPTAPPPALPPLWKKPVLAT